jgi:hypothetical protein
MKSVLVKLFFQHHNVFIPDIGFIDIGSRQYENMTLDQYNDFMSQDRRIRYKPVDKSSYYVIVKIESFILDDPDIVDFLSKKGGIFSFNILKLVHQFESLTPNEISSLPKTIKIN